MVLKTVPRLLLALTLLATFPRPVLAQTAPPSETSVDKGKGATGPRKQLATIVFAGLGGAVLGLSTLSFYGRPQENLRNIAIGAAFGVIAGTAMVTYKAATNPTELYGEQRAIERDFDATTIASNIPAGGAVGARPLGFNFNFEF